MGSRRLEIFRTPRHGYTDYAVGWLFVHVVTLPTALIVAAEGGAGIGFGVLFGGVFLGALGWRRSIVNRCLRRSPFYRRWLIVTVALLLAVTAPGVTGNLPRETFNAWLLGLLVAGGVVLFAGWYRAIRRRL